MEKLVAFLKQPSTIKGVMVLAGLVGINLSAELWQEIGTALVAAVGLYEAIRNERSK